MATKSSPSSTELMARLAERTRTLYPSGGPLEVYRPSVHARTEFRDSRPK